ncbi:MAG TPA: acyltransferase [Mycobacteriales bacterium]|nr:acyltransferase [Mycobacteriales bacterium]
MTRASEKPARLRYIPALDGLRGLSLPGTILTHFALLLQAGPGAPSWLSSVGPLTMNIQMFFVLSGALITSLLVAEHRRNGEMNLAKFYVRRSRRLGPALLAVLPAMILLTVFWSGHGVFQPLGVHPARSVVVVGLFVGNWALYAVSGGIGWLGPAWTLGIEEQFYLTWPWLLRATARRHIDRRAVLLGLALAVVLALGITEILFTHVGRQRAFYSTPAQLPSILIGCALGYELTANPGGRLAAVLRSRVVALGGLAGMVVVSIVAAHHPSYEIRGWYAVYAGFACLLIGHCFVSAEHSTFVTKVFAWRPFVIIGQISYEAYLIHVIVMLAVLRALPHLHVYPMMGLDLVIVAVLSAGFYYRVEQPIRRDGWRSVVLRARPVALGSVAEPAREYAVTGRVEVRGDDG